jgi:hypothetical protein
LNLNLLAQGVLRVKVGVGVCVRVVVVHNFRL